MMRHQRNRPQLLFKSERLINALPAHAMKGPAAAGVYVRARRRPFVRGRAVREVFARCCGIYADKLIGDRLISRAASVVMSSRPDDRRAVDAELSIGRAARITRVAISRADGAFCGGGGGSAAIGKTTAAVTIKRLGQQIRGLCRAERHAQVAVSAAPQPDEALTGFLIYNLVLTGERLGFGQCRRSPLACGSLD